MIIQSRSMVLFATRQNVCEEVIMKTSTSGFSPLTVSLSIVTVLLMVTGSSMAAPVQKSIGQVHGILSPSVMKSYIYSSSLAVSKIVGETQADFAEDRLGDKNYDEYIARIPGLPLPSWNPDQMTEQAFLSKTVEELHLFREAIEEMRAHESQNKSSQFTAKFQEIEYEIDYLKNQIQNVQLLLGYTVTQPSVRPQDFLKPTATQKQQDDLELGVLKEFLWWFVPVQAKFYRDAMA